MTKELLVKDVMSEHLKTITPETSLAEISDHFRMYHFHHLPVMSEGELRGIVSSSDCKKIIEGIELVKEFQDIDLKKVYHSIKADRIMSRNPFSVPPETSIREVAEVFREEKFHAIPVLSKGVLVGIVTHHDINYYK